MYAIRSYYVKKGKTEMAACQLCGKGKTKVRLVAAALVSAPVAETIRREHPAWTADGYVCLPDLNRFRSLYIQSLLETEKA